MWGTLSIVKWKQPWILLGNEWWRWPSAIESCCFDPRFLPVERQFLDWCFDYIQLWKSTVIPPSLWSYSGTTRAPRWVWYGTTAENTQLVVGPTAGKHTNTLAVTAAVSLSSGQPDCLLHLTSLETLLQQREALEGEWPPTGAAEDQERTQRGRESDDL